MTQEHPLYIIEEFIVKDTWSYLYSETRWEKRVSNKKTEKVIFRFYRDDNEDSRGREITGYKEVGFSEDGQYVIMVDEEGKVEKHKLPE